MLTLKESETRHSFVNARTINRNNAISSTKPVNLAYLINYEWLKEVMVTIRILT